MAAVDWYLPSRVRRVVDLGAGTGALTRLLVDRADDVVAVEPDDRMRDVLAAEVPGARALAGTGEAVPLADDSVDAVIASTSWHWMDPGPTLAEMARILVPGGHWGHCGPRLTPKAACCPKPGPADPSARAATRRRTCPVWSSARSGVVRTYWSSRTEPCSINPNTHLLVGHRPRR